jgi:predicted naringenin-chalcone synthase
MTERNLRYKQEAPLLAEKAAKNALDRWGGECSKISHILSVSCTGVMAPGIEFHLMQKLGLSSTANRLGINFMGCFGAFKGLSVGAAFSRENPESRILLVCTELCSLHLQSDQDEETITANSLFSDGSAAAIIGSSPCPEETSLWEIVRTRSMGFENSIDKMSWEASDTGFRMRLSHTVPVLIKREINKFSKDLLMNDAKPEECDWAIHPGGKSILQAVEKGLQLEPDQTKASWKVLSDYGNMSSASFLFVLDELSRQKREHLWTAGLGFGPGLSAEGVLLKRSLVTQEV